MTQSEEPLPITGAELPKQRTPLEFLGKLLKALIILVAALGALCLAFVIFLRVLIGGFMGHP
jgi:hypothetical protein